MEGVVEWYGRTNRYALDFGVRIRYSQIIEEEHAVEWFGEELDLQMICYPIYYHHILHSYSPVYSQL